VKPEKLLRPSLWLAPLLLAASVGTAGCEDKHPGGGSSTAEPPGKEAGSLASAVMSAAPEPPRPPVLTVDDTSVVVSGDRVDFAGPDAKGRVAALLGTKPHVVGEMVEVNALRDTSTPHFAAVVEALREAKAKGATVKTALRDRTLGELSLLVQHPPAASCAAVAMIAKDNAILVWSYGGGGNALRYAHGMAGPDITLGSESLRKRANACESSVYFVSADDSIKWGMVFDLAVAARGAADAGVAFRPSSVVVLAKPPVPGVKITE
jgi:hypothetical protein